jgi:hypothetical protein
MNALSHLFPEREVRESIQIRKYTHILMHADACVIKDGAAGTQGSLNCGVLTYPPMQMSVNFWVCVCVWNRCQSTCC